MILRDWTFAFAAVAWLLVGAAEARQEQPSLYSAVTVITGRDSLPERARGMREGFAAILMKLTADRAVLEEPAVAEALGRAGDFVKSFSYTDRKAGVQISDEQGTRDRSFLFEVQFDAPKVDVLLAEAGLSSWPVPRPVLTLDLDITDGSGRFDLTESSERGRGQREVATEEAAKAGLPLHLVEQTQDEGQAGARLLGAMIITPEGYWNTEWELRASGVSKRWSIGDSTFDRAIADGIWTAAASLRKARMQ